MYDFILAFEGGTQYFDGTYYTVFNNGIDNNLELTCGVAIGTLNGETYSSVKKILGRDVKVGDKLTVEEYSKIFEQTAQSKMQIVDSAITKTGVVLNQQQKDAVYSLCWNASGASKTIQDALNKFKTEGDKGYWGYIHSYTRSGDSRPKGLVRRRAEEFELFRTGDYAVSGVDEGVNKHRSYNKEFGFNEFAGE